MSLRQEFVHLAGQDGANVRALCRQFGISPKTAYKWLNRFEAAAGEVQALHDLSDAWRPSYSCERPHEALAMGTPVQRYQPSAVAYSGALRPIEYPHTDCVVTVGWNGFVHFQRRKLHVASALQGLPIGIRPSSEGDGVHDVYFCHQRFTRFDLREPVADT